MKHPLKDLANLLHRPVESAARSCPPHMLTSFLEAVVEALHSRQFIQDLAIAGIFGNNQPASPQHQQLKGVY